MKKHYRATYRQGQADYWRGIDQGQNPFKPVAHARFWRLGWTIEYQQHQRKNPPNLPK